ncbi:MAG: beta-galactosidase trimerization domain-containing protein [Planctomycetes bacterium]|nr:beta-galactosidase trimerization domain-containing protein [Planctomycetota bacterium]MBL7143562.1 beta-galactosidase trimerization domain-containing protein [Phycisphaerae bacterium]
MDRRDFLKTSVVAGGYAILGRPLVASAEDSKPWFDRPMRWAQLVLVENDPGRFDPDFWLDYFKRIHADAACLSAGGAVAYYPTKIPMHHRSAWLGDSDPFGYLVRGCRKMSMAVIARTDPHATWNNVYQAHPDWIAVDSEGQKRRHWSNPELWVTCAFGPYNFEFMTQVHKEIMTLYQLEGIFSNRWAGHGLCYCEHCVRNFKSFSGMDLPRTSERHDPVYRKYSQWRIERLKELWFLWDKTIRKVKSTSRYIPNGFPDNVVTGALSDIFFTDHQARSGVIPPWSNGKRAKELRATMGMKPLGGIFSIGLEERYRWKDSVQSEPEIRIWVAEGTANNMRPWFVKFSGTIYDKRWLKVVERIYQWHYRVEPYLRNIAPLARTAMVYSEQTEKHYGGEKWQQGSNGHELGMYHALVEARVPFEMVNDRLLDAEHLKAFKLLILPNVAALSEMQCEQLRQYVKSGGSLVATFETSLYDQDGKKRQNFGLADMFGLSYKDRVEGPMKNSYLRLKINSETGRFHPVLSGLEDAYRIINGVWRLDVQPNLDFPSPVTLIPTYPDLPMEHVYPRKPETDIREVYLRELGESRIAYIPWDIDRTFWEIMNVDHGKLLRNIINWAANEEPPVKVTGPGIIDLTVWRQKQSMTVHLVNFTNAMMMKGPFREFIPIGEQNLQIKIPRNTKVKKIHLLVSGTNPDYQTKDDIVSLIVPSILDHEVVALDLET